MHPDVLPTLALAAGLGVAVVAVASRLRVPGILLLLAAGMGLGVGGLQWLRPASLGGGLALLVEVCVAAILFEGSITLRPVHVLGHGKVVRNLLSIGALVTLVGATCAAWLVLGYPLRHAVLVGAILVVTGPTVVIPLLRWVRPKAHLAEILRWEGILIDPIGALAAVVVLEAVLAGAQGGVARFLLSYATTLGAGVGVGAGVGLLLDALLRRPGLVEPSLQGALGLAAILASFGGAEFVHGHAGLFGVTTAGVVLAWRGTPGLEALEAFLSSLVHFVLPLVFVLLAAGVDPGDVTSLGVPGLVFLLALVGVRALSVAASTFRSALPWSERAFLAWVAPRGVVAATVASLFTASLVTAGDAEAGRVLAAVVLVIVGTVVVQAATARPIARALGVLADRPRRVMIVGAGPFGLAFAREIAALGLPVTLVDKNPARLAAVDVAGVTALVADVHDEQQMAGVEEADLALVVAATPNDEANALACATMAHRAAHALVSQLPASDWALARSGRHAAASWPFPFGDRLTLAALEGALAAGGRLRTVPVVAPLDATELRRRLGTPFRPLLEVRASGEILPVSVRNATLRAGSAVVGVEGGAEALA